MIKMGEITCRIPTNGIKPEILYCTEPEGYKLDQWMVSIDLIVAALTVLLFIVAYRTLRQMKKDSVQQWESVKRQMAEQAVLARQTADSDRELAREQHQMELLVTHVKAIRDLQMRTRDSNGDLVEALSDVSITWAMWSMYLHGRHDSMLTVTQIYLDSLSTSSQIVDARVAEFHTGQIPLEKLKALVDGWGDCVGNYIGNLTVWQSVEESRPEKEKNIRINLNRLDALIKENTAHESNV